MKPKAFLISGSILMAAWFATGAALAQSSGTKRDTLKPDPSGKGASIGESQSERSGESGAPLPQGSPHTGTVGMDKSSIGGSEAARAGMGGNMRNVKEVQQALKDKGYDPGPIDGVMGSRTKEAIKSFQSASRLPVTGTLTAETVEKLGVHSGSQGSKASSESSGSRDNVKSNDTSEGKDTDRPNQTPSKNR